MGDEETGGCPGRPGETQARANEEVHRLSNVLQILATLFAHRRRTLADEVALEQIEWAEEIVQSLILLATSHVGRRDDSFDAYLARLLGRWCPVFAESGIELAWRIDDVAIPEAMGGTLARIVNELLSNALKHAFVDRAGGHVHVSLCKLRGNAAELIVADDGVGLPAAGMAPNSGLTLLHAMATEVGATLTMENAGGVTARLRFRPAQA